MDEVRQGYFGARIEQTVKNLIKHEFKAIQVSDRSVAREEILKRILPDERVGVGGSLSVRETGVIAEMERRGNVVYDHWKPGLSKEEVFGFRKSQMTCDLFLSSANAVTMSGELVNIDGIGNRVNSISFGPAKVILVAGANKIVEDVQEAIKRIKNVAAPLNARRLNIDVPCAKLGRCVDCNSPNRICRIVTILERKPSLTDILVILVGEELGF